MGEKRTNITVTLASYEQGVETYLHGSRPAPVAAYQEFLSSVVALLPPNPEMLELGSGPGHDALFFEANGVRVQRTDGVKAFVERLRSSGHQAELLDLTTDEFGGPYDIVFANAVLLHLTPLQLDDALAKATRAVGPTGFLAFTLKEGDGEAWTTEKIDLPRYFTYWREPAIRTRLTAIGWKPLSVQHVQGRIEPWLYLVCQRDLP